MQITISDIAPRQEKLLQISDALEQLKNMLGYMADDSQMGEEAAEYLDDALEALDDAIDSIADAVEELEEEDDE